MTKTKSTKRALLMSALALTLCVSMLIGSTFAWFTDSVTSANNIIKSGNLDIELEYWDGDSWEDVAGKSDILTNTLWEPGVTEVAYLRVANAGSLALKYQLGVNIVSETAGVNVADEEFKLSDYIQFGVVEGVNGETGAYTKDDAGRAAAIAAVTDAKKISAGYTKADSLTAGAAPVYLALVVYMPTTVGNEANYKTGTNAPEINLGINVFATQFTHEEDSFDKYYDKGAPWTGGVDTKWYDDNTTATEFVLTSAEELAGFAKLVNSGVDTFTGKTVKLGANVDLNKVAWTPIGNNQNKWANKFDGTFIGTGYTISNLYAVGASGVGLFGYVGDSAHIEGVTIDGAYVKGNDYVGAVMGTGYLAANCLKNNTVKNATIIAEPYLMADGVTYDGGAKAGAVAGYAINGNITGNKAINCEISAYRDLGGIVGMAAGEDRPITVSGNTVDTVTLEYTAVTSYADGKKNENMGEIVGRYDKAKVTVENNIATNVKGVSDEWDGTVDTDWYNETAREFVLNTAEQFAGFAKLVADDANNFAGKTLTLANDIDLAGKSFAPIGTTGERDSRNRLVVEPFKGTFDGNGHAISNLSQSGWDFGYEWGQYGSIGLFSELEGATVKNVVLEGFDCAIEGGDISFIAGSATGDCTFENIEIKSGSIGTYNNGIGGIIGWSGAGTYNFKNITIGEDVVIGGLWGSFDSSVGGIVGQAEPGATYNFENVNIACRLDVYNDCTASYDYYNYRMCGMIIGRLEETTTIDGSNYPDTSKYNITCKNVTVTYGEWANYHYCEPTPGLNGGRGMRVEPGYEYDGLPADFDHTQCTTNHMTLIPFDQIFGGDQLGVKGLKAYEGVTVVYNNK